MRLNVLSHVLNASRSILTRHVVGHPIQRPKSHVVRVWVEAPVLKIRNSLNGLNFINRRMSKSGVWEMTSGTSCSVSGHFAPSILPVRH